MSVEDKIPVGPAVSLPVNCTCQIRPDPHEKKLKTFNFHFLTKESLKKKETSEITSDAVVEIFEVGGGSEAAQGVF